MTWTGQEILLSVDDNYMKLREYFFKMQVKKLLLVCGNSFQHIHTGRLIRSITRDMGIRCVFFSDFSPNPAYDSVAKGVKLFEREGCNMILAVGGGSAIDVAKCIKIYSSGRLMSIPLLAVPTTAGSGSEATRFAVVYRDGEKLSIVDDKCIPDAVMLDPRNLRSLPEYQRKASMMDAFCHAVESFWSVHATSESKIYAKQALQLIMENFEKYLSNREEGNRSMLMAAHFAGKAINITKTTAGHAMCYKLTGLYGIAHGHAAALCVAALWPYMLRHMEFCIESRGREYLEATFEEIAKAMGCVDRMNAPYKFQQILDSLQFETLCADEEDIELLKISVNAERLKNNPVRLDEHSMEKLYRRILNIDKIQREEKMVWMSRDL